MLPDSMRTWLIRVLIVLAVVVGYLVLDATVLAPDPISVRIARAERGRVEATVTNSKAGTVKARRRAKLSPGTSGIVVELPIVRGDRVRAEEILLRLDDATQSAQLALASEALEVAQARSRERCIAAERARRELERNRKLAEEELVSVDVLDGLDSAYQLADASCAVARAEVQQARASVAVAQAEQDKTVLRAPFDAVIAEVSVELGEWVTPSVPLLAAPDVIDAIDSRSLYISAPMDEVDADKLEPGLPTRVTVDSHPDRVFDARLTKVAPYVLDLEQQNRTLEVEVELDDADFSATLLPGTSADVEIVLEVRDDVLRIPTYALMEDDRVLVLEEGVLAERVVETGMRNWDFAEIVDGLAEGERVVTSLDRPEVQAGVEAVVESASAPR